MEIYLYIWNGVYKIVKWSEASQTDRFFFDSLRVSISVCVCRLFCCDGKLIGTLLLNKIMNIAHYTGAFAATGRRNGRKYTMQWLFASLFCICQWRDNQHHINVVVVVWCGVSVALDHSHLAEFLRQCLPLCVWLNNIFFLSWKITTTTENTVCMCVNVCICCIRYCNWAYLNMPRYSGRQLQVTTAAMPHGKPNNGCDRICTHTIRYTIDDCYVHGFGDLCECVLFGYSNLCIASFAICQCNLHVSCSYIQFQIEKIMN